MVSTGALHNAEKIDLVAATQSMVQVQSAREAWWTSYERTTNPVASVMLASNQISSLHKFCEWLASTSVSTVIRDVSWVIPLTQTVHIVCIALLIGSASMLELRVFGFVGRSETITATAKRLIPWVWWPLPVFLTSGLILIVAEPSRELENTTFVIKMLLLVAAVAVTGLLQAALRRTPDLSDSPLARIRWAKVLAFVSLSLFISIIFAGRLIAYTDHP